MILDITEAFCGEIRIILSFSANNFFKFLLSNESKNFKLFAFLDRLGAKFLSEKFLST